MPPFFSVVIPLYNKEHFIEATLKSVITQTFKDFEIIIINDGSTDSSIQKVKAFKDSRITVHTQENQGLSEARNAGIKKATANYIALIDADDLWLPTHLEALHNLINLYPNKGLYCTSYTLQKSESVFHRAQFNGLPHNFVGVVPNFFEHSLQNCVAWVSAICIPKKTFKTIGYFDPEIFSEQDTDLYIRIVLKYDVVLDSNSVSAIYNRTIDDNMSNFSEKKEIPKLLYSYKSIEANNVALKTYLDYNRFSTLIYFKLSSNNKLAKKLADDIDFNNLTKIQRLLVRLPNGIVKFLFYIKTKFNLNALIVFKTKS